MGAALTAHEILKSISEVGFFSTSCLLKGLDPEKVRAEMIARQSRRDYQPCPKFSIPGSKEKIPDGHTSPANHSPVVVTDLAAPGDMPTFRSKEELKAFLIDLLAESIVEICLGVMKGRS